jgi:ribonuclease PH
MHPSLPEGFLLLKGGLVSISTRAHDQLRPVSFELDYVMHPEGSVLIVVGNTRVLCNASVIETLPPWLKYAKKRHGWVTAEYAMLPRSTAQRNDRETRTPKGRTQEIQRLIARSLRGAVDLNKLGERQIVVDCDVIQADGGTRTASITGGYVALAMAIRRLEQRGLTQPGALIQPVAAVSVGLLDGQAMLDLDYAMDLKADVDMNVVMTGDGRFIEVQGTAEGEPFPRPALDAMLQLAEVGISELLALQAQALAQ